MYRSHGVRSLGLDHSRKFKVFAVYTDRRSRVAESRIADWGWKLFPPKLNTLEIGETHWCMKTRKGYERLN